MVLYRFPDVGTILALLKGGAPYASCKISAKSDQWFWRRSRLNGFTIYGHDGHLEFLEFRIMTFLAKSCITIT